MKRLLPLHGATLAAAAAGVALSGQRARAVIQDDPVLIVGDDTLGLPRPRPPAPAPQPPAGPRALTHTDLEALRLAEIKRARKAARLKKGMASHG